MDLIITKNPDGKTLTIALEGTLDTVTSPQLEAELDQIPSGTENLVFDFEKLTYISSAGLRAMIGAEKKMSAKNGAMKIINVSEILKEIFDVTGLSGALGIE